ncbi:MAG: hypothetical protein ABI444_10980 [Candidatus Kapaibacterium sp.]|jgi:hypothetical protein
MTENSITQNFPRELTPFEAEILAWILPSDRAGYREYAEFVRAAKVLGEGRWGTGDYLLAHEAHEIDLTSGMRPVIAFGEIKLDSGTLTLSTHEPEDGMMEVQFGSVELIESHSRIISKWCYSYWKPGEPCPATGSRIREITYYDANAKPLYVLAISKMQRNVWLHHAKSGFNQLLAVTGYYESLLRLKHEAKRAMPTSNREFFDQLDTWSDNEMYAALLDYNTEARKFDASLIVSAPQSKPTLFAKMKQALLQQSNPRK